MILACLCLCMPILHKSNQYNLLILGMGSIYVVGAILNQEFLKGPYERTKENLALRPQYSLSRVQGSAIKESKLSFTTHLFPLGCGYQS